MCGFLAVINPKKKDIPYLKERLEDLHHRGPDSNGIYNNQSCFLGFKRLVIIDSNKRSDQPFTKKHHHLVYNGEIYNYLELIKEHKLQVTTKSDTEVVLEMYLKYKEKCLAYFNGMFSFVIYNEKENTFFIARDRLGIKPLYYSKEGNSIYFSSEIAPIQKIVNSEFDDFGIRQYKKLRMTLNQYTIYKKIKFFPAGHYMKNNKIIKYWNLNIDKKDPPSDEELKFTIEDAIRLRKRSDVPIGSYLSGGLDSTIATYILKPNYTWSVGFKELNEFEWSRLANKGIKTKHNEIIVNKNSFLTSLKYMVKKRLEPLSVPNEVLIYLMTKEVKKKNTVILSGEGADELFWGYDRIFRMAFKLKEFNINDFDKYYSYGSHKDPEVLDYATNSLPGTSFLDKIGYFFQIYHLHGLLRRLDNSTMLCSVEARVPFVDHRLVEMMAGTPFEWRMGNSIKEPLKRIFNDLIPKEIINRNKVGFPVPLKTIFTNNNANPMDNWLNYNLSLLKGEI